MALTLLTHLKILDVPGIKLIVEGKHARIDAVVGVSCVSPGRV